MPTTGEEKADRRVNTVATLATDHLKKKKKKMNKIKKRNEKKNQQQLLKFWRFLRSVVLKFNHLLDEKRKKCLLLLITATSK